MGAPRLRAMGRGWAVTPALAFMLLVASFVLACTADEPADLGRSFYAEIAVEVEPQADDPLARIGVATEGGGAIRWWYAGPDRWRWEIETTGPAIDAGTLLTVFDGEHEWGYDDRSNAYQRADPPELPAGLVRSPIFSAPVGPANAESIEAFMEQWRERGSDTNVRLGGEEAVLGRRTQIVEIRPAWSSGSSSAATASTEGEKAAPSVEGAALAGGVVRVFIDPERMFIMRWAVDGEGGGQSYSAGITALEYGEPIDEALFAFESPPGAREVSASDSGSGCRTALGGLGFGVPAGFLRPSYLPAGYGSSASGAESGADGCSLVAAWALMESVDDGYVLLRQRIRAGGVPAALRTGEAVQVSGHDGYRSEEEDGVARLVWFDGEIVAELTSNALPATELLRIAESAALVPGVATQDLRPQSPPAALEEIRARVDFPVFVPTYVPAGLTPSIARPATSPSSSVHIDYFDADGIERLNVVGCPFRCAPFGGGEPGALTRDVTVYFVEGEVYIDPARETHGFPLWWEQDGAYLIVSSREYGKDELTRIAASMSSVAGLSAAP